MIIQNSYDQELPREKLLHNIVEPNEFNIEMAEAGNNVMLLTKAFNNVGVKWNCNLAPQRFSFEKKDANQEFN